MARSPSAREVSRCGALGPGALGEFREGFSGHGLLGELPGGALGARPLVTRGGLGSIRGVLPAGYSGTRVVLAGLPDVVYGLGTRGQVAFSATSGGSLSRGTRGQVSHSEASGEVSLAVHSGTSGRILSVGVLGTRVALASFRVKYLSLGFTAHSGASGRLAAHSELPGTRGAFGGFRVLSLAGLPGWSSGQVSYSEGF